MIRVKLDRHAFEIALNRSNLSQRDLAQMTGFSRSHVSHIINGRREPSPALRRAILQQLRDCTFDDIFIIEDGADGD